MALASKHLAVFQPHHARATTPRGTCTAAGGLDAETLRGFQLAGELFSLTSFFIEPKGCEFETCLKSQIHPLRALSAFLVNAEQAPIPRMANM
jgi:hypothetical protein